MKLCWWQSTAHIAVLILYETLEPKSRKSNTLVVPWCSGYLYCTTSFNWAWTQVLRKFKPCSRRVGKSRWWGSLTMVPAGNRAKYLSSVNHTTKLIHHHHHHHHHHFFTTLKISDVEPPLWKSVRIQTFSDFYFPAFGLTMEKHGVYLRI